MRCCNIRQLLLSSLSSGIEQQVKITHTIYDNKKVILHIGHGNVLLQ
jgi:hypothetical protein